MSICMYIYIYTMTEPKNGGRGGQTFFKKYKGGQKNSHANYRYIYVFINKIT